MSLPRGAIAVVGAAVIIAMMVGAIAALRLAGLWHSALAHVLVGVVTVGLQVALLALVANAEPKDSSSDEGKG